MTDLQLYLAIGVPSFAVLLGILSNVIGFTLMNSRLSAMEARVTSLEGRMDNRMAMLETRQANFEARLEIRIDARFDMLMGKVDEIDTRLTRIEERR